MFISYRTVLVTNKNIERISDDLFISHSEDQKELVSWDGSIQMDIDDIDDK